MTDIRELKLYDLQPSQFYISEKKLRDIREWFDPQDLSGLEPIPVKMLEGVPVMTDGHTRAVAALLCGLDRVPFAGMKMILTGKCTEDAFRNAGSGTSSALQICSVGSFRKANIMRNGTGGVIACRQKL